MKRYGLIGKTLSHSFSKPFFEKKFAAENISGCSYENFELASIEELPSLLAQSPEIRGLNVTIPYKESVIPLLTRKNHIVQSVGACNCIRVEKDGSLSGFNTDVMGFKKSLEGQLADRSYRALILGSGGASKAVQYALMMMQIPFQLVSSSGASGSIPYEALVKDLMAEHLLIINTTPVGMSPNVNEKPPLPYRFISSEHFLFDLIYNPEKTEFLKEGLKHNAKISNGYEMLVLQAEESWRIWNDLEE